MGRLDLPDPQTDEQSCLRSRIGCDDLSPHLLRVLVRVAQGDTNEEIAGARSVSIETVKGEVKDILRGLDAQNRAHAVAIGFRRGIIT